MIKNKQLKIQKLILIAVLLAIVIFVVFTGRSLSKYIYNSIHSYYLQSKGFYFNSDKLSLNHSEFELENNWSGGETYTITVNLNSKKNDLLCTKADVSYTISYTHSDNIACEIDKTSGVIVGTDNGGVNEGYFTITIDPAQGQVLLNGDQAWIDVVVTSTSPYVQEISGKLIIETGSDDITYEIVDSVGAPYIEVNIINSTNSDEVIGLNFSPTAVLLDMTNDFTLNNQSLVTTAINGNQYVNRVNSKVNAFETTTVKFYKKDTSQDYTYRYGDTSLTPVVTLIK